MENGRDGSRAVLAAALTVGFGTVVGMWLVGFVTHLPGLRPPAVVIAVLLLAIQALGGWIAGRIGGGSMWVGALAGLFTGLVNLLIVGSVVSSLPAEGAGGSELVPNWAVIAAGSVAFSTIVGLIAGAIGLKGAPHGAATREEWLWRFALVTVSAAMPVLLSGGLVTSTGTGLAVPDWPTSYSANMFLYPLSKMTGGIYYEHAHRLFGSLIGFTTLVLMIFMFIVERRGWVKVLGVLAFVMVCAQGVLGGVRVTSATTVSEVPSPEALSDNRMSLALAALHGTTAQIFFGFLCALAVVLSPAWQGHDGSVARETETRLRPMGVALVAALMVQLALGSVTRHFQHAHAMLTHIGFALVVIVLACLVGFRAGGGAFDHLPMVKRLGKSLVHAVGLQAALGVATLLVVFPYEPGRQDPAYAVIIATSHQATGALLMGCAWALAAWGLRLGTRAAA